MKTAVDYLIEQLAKNGVLHSSDIAKAKEMEKQQIIDAYRNGKINQLENSEIYYNQTFSK